MTLDYKINPFYRNEVKCMACFWAAGAEITIGRVFLSDVEHCEVIDDGKPAALCRAFQETVAEISPGWKVRLIERCIERSICGHQVNESLRISGRPGATLPNRSFLSVGRDIDNGNTLQRVRAVRDNPACVRIAIAMRSPRCINNAV